MTDAAKTNEWWKRTGGKEMKKETALNFMLYTLLEVTLNDVDTDGKPVTPAAYIEKAVRRAYRDAASHVLSIEKGEGVRKNPYLRNKAVSVLVEKLKSIKSNNKVASYDEWHKEVCKELTEQYAEGKVAYKYENRKFSYGIAQKWVNMAVKYLTILYTVMSGAKNDNISVNEGFIKFYEENFIGFEEKFQIPVDGYILEGVWRLEDKKILDPVVAAGKKYNGNYDSTKVISWSKWSEYEDQYMKFQKELRKVMDKEKETPLDWENRTWIEVSKRRKPLSISEERSNKHEEYIARL